MLNSTRENNKGKYDGRDIYTIQGKTYAKPHVGEKMWAVISDNAAGRFVDILIAKFDSSSKVDKSVNLKK